MVFPEGVIASREQTEMMSEETQEARKKTPRPNGNKRAFADRTKSNADKA